MPAHRLDERALMRLADEYLTENYGVVVDDVVLRTWGNGQAELVHLLLGAAVESSGVHADPSALWPAARAIAFPDRSDAPWLDDVNDQEATPVPKSVETADDHRIDGER